MYNTCDYVNISDDVRSQERNIKITHKILQKKYFPSHSYMFSLPVTFNVINLPVFLL